jgi:dihydroorotate dehydrogenase electron transfer subunit
MYQGKYQIISNIPLTEQIYKMVLLGSTAAIKRAGQFVNIAIDGLYLRRPISICDFDENTITLIYKIVGVGTEQMSQMKIGSTLDLLVGLGNGFNIDVDCKKPIVIGGGVGIPPLFYLTKKLIDRCHSREGGNLHTTMKQGDSRLRGNDSAPTVLLCFNTKSEIFYYEEFKKLGVDVFVATTDGSFGTKGFALDAISENKIDFDYYFTCGPLPMLKSLHENLTTAGQLSFEEKMGCGFGGCMGCTHKTKNGYKKVCTDTILYSNEIYDL